MISLNDLLIHGHPPERIISIEPERTWRDLAARIARCRVGLPVNAEKPWLLAVDSGFDFAAALVACWQSAIPILISQDTQPGTLLELRRLTSGCITDRDLGIHWGKEILPSSFEHSATCSLDKVPAPISRRQDEVAFELFTSGSSGSRTRVPKTFAQLDGELAAFDRQWGRQLSGRPTYGMVSHLHFYGLMFKALWSLCRGEPAASRNSFFWEELLGILPEGPATIVSAPTHLRHLPTVAARFPRDWKDTTIFSSGGPLPLETAHEIAALCSHPPLEIYGSTETGAIAWRQQTEKDSVPWSPLPGVATRVNDGLLEVSSGWVSEDWFRLQDKAAAAGPGNFNLLGRADRLVKIFEKRISLDEMESKLRDHESVQDARVLVLPVSSHTSRDQLGVVVELNANGRRRLAQTGKAALAREFKRHLGLYFEPVTLPRRWRLVLELPRDTQGKIPHASLLALFNPPSRPTRPEVLNREETPSGILLRLRTPPDLAYLEGHFPGQPVVPGVCQLKWVADEIEALTGRKAEIVGMTAVKFHEILRPSEEFSLELSFSGAAASRWKYHFFAGEKTISSGRLELAS